MSGRSAECLTNHPGAAGAAYGYPGMGGYPGTQAELVRVPFGDANCLRLPGEPGEDWEHDFVLLADALPTGYHATELAGVSAGDSVAVFGAGAIGLLAAMCARLRGAADVYVVDRIADRLDKAGEMGFEPIDFMAGDPVEQILAHRRTARPRASSAYRGEDPLLGVTCGIDAIGFQARAQADPTREDPHWVTRALAQLLQPGGRLGVIGVFLDSIRARSASPSATGCCRSPGSAVQEGRAHRDGPRPRRALQRPPARPDHHRSDPAVDHRQPPARARPGARGAFRRFDERRDGYLKVILSPTGRYM